MSQTPILLHSFAKNVYSQWGEDGILAKIFEVIGTTSKLCVEFGAADGFWFSNTASLWSKGTKEDWKAVLIEADAKHKQSLEQLAIKYPNCVTIQSKVEAAKGPTCLASLLSNRGVVGKIDLLSIDIDSDDWGILESLKRDGLKPRVVIVEHNPTLPYWMDICQKPGCYCGSSVGALTRIARNQGYMLVAVTDTNCIFVDEQERSKFNGLYEFDLHKMAGPVLCKYLTCLVSSYNGRTKLVRSSAHSCPYGSNGDMGDDLIVTI